MRRTVAERMVKGQRMGRFAVDVELANALDVDRAGARAGRRAKVRRLTIRGVVDTGATQLVIPVSAAQALGLKPARTARVRYADGRTARRGMVDGVRLTCNGRTSIFSAIVEPQRELALIGAVVLETLDFLPDCTRQELVPRDPRFIVSEIE